MVDELQNTQDVLTTLESESECEQGASDNSAVEAANESCACSQNEVLNSQPKRDMGPQSILGTFAQMDSSAIKVRQERCVKVRNRNVSCLKCADACTSNCISLVDGVLHVDVTNCVGCGTCATVCPTCALETHNPSDAQLFSQCMKTASEKEVCIACNPMMQAADAYVSNTNIATVVCLGRVDESLLVRLIAKGIKKITLVCGQCEHCAQAHGRKTAEMVVDSVNSLLHIWNLEATLELTDCFSPQFLLNESNSEELQSHCDTVFSSGVGNSPLAICKDNDNELASQSPDSLQPEEIGGSANTRTLEKGLVHVMKDGTLPHFLPDRRETLIDALSSFGEPSQSVISSRLWGCVVIDGNKCSSCRMCATFCPTAAITKFDEEDGTFGVTHFPADCVKCGSCVDICPEQAIIMLDDVKTAYLLESEKHRYTMKPRAAQTGTAQQILNHMRVRMQGSDIFER